MIQITIQVEGMACNMCENHVNDVIRRTFQVKKVTSSHSKNQTVIIADRDIEDSKLREAIASTGYTVGAITRENYEKKGLFSFFKK